MSILKFIINAITTVGINKSKLLDNLMAPFVIILIIINVGRNDRKNVTILQPKYDQNMYGLNFIGFNSFRIISPDCMLLLISQTINISRKLKSAVARTRYIMVSLNVIPLTISVPADLYIDFQRKYIKVKYIKLANNVINTPSLNWSCSIIPLRVRLIYFLIGMFYLL